MLNVMSFDTECIFSSSGAKYCLNRRPNQSGDKISLNLSVNINRPVLKYLRVKIFV